VVFTGYYLAKIVQAVQLFAFKSLKEF
ncbi:MAG: hypothetical protein ACJAVT_000231, partial [Yoonia sp.]